MRNESTPRAAGLAAQRAARLVRRAVLAAGAALLAALPLHATA